MHDRDSVDSTDGGRGPPGDRATTDLVTFGETMFRLSPQGGDRLETAGGLDLHVGGAESNVAVAARRLGCETAWLSKLPDSPLGRRVATELRSHGVDVAVTWADEGRLGTYYVDPGGAPRGTDVIYDRAGAAVRTATPADLDASRVREARVCYTSGITPALSETLADTTTSLLRAAREAGTTTAFDLNYRSKLWSPAEARATLADVLGLVDWLVVAERDAETVLELDVTAAEQARALEEEFGCETVVVTRGADGALALHDGEVLHQSPFETETRDAIGTGDAFVGGFLASRIDGADVGSALRYAAATAALKRTVAGDLAVVTRDEVERVVAGDAGSLSR